jgi:hypothetical protein
MSQFAWFCIYVVCSQTQHIKPSAQIHMYDTEDVYKLLNSHNQKFTLNHLVEIQKQTTHEKAQMEPKKRAVMVTKLTEGFWTHKSWPQGV